MRFKHSQKAEAHERILRAAAQMMRDCGPEKISVDGLMRKAGLTHGGFYAHFKSRDAMVAETLQAIFAEVERAYHLTCDDLSPREALTTYINLYLSPEHRDGAVPSCPVVAFGGDLSRESRQFRNAYKAGLEKLIVIVAGWMAAAGVDNAKVTAASLLSAMAGSIHVSRGVEDPRLADAILKATRESLLARLGL
jgi:TetR/AcrR family transcriptional repressor of nem operon